MPCGAIWNKIKLSGNLAYSFPIKNLNIKDQHEIIK